MNSAVYLLCIVFCTVEYHCARSNAIGLSQSLLDAIRYVDSLDDVCALGDEGVSLGSYQIMQEYYSVAVEANTTLTASGEEYEDLWGEGSVRYSERVVNAYVLHFATPNRLGHVPTDEDFARIHHGGPDGWNSSSTQEYWRRVSAAMKSGIAVPNGVNTDKCNPRCKVRQCCDRNEDGNYECFCLQAKANSPDRYIKRPCENCSEIAGIDIVFVLDSSGSIGSTNFQKMRNFVTTVINDLDIGPTRTQVGVIVFSSTASISFHLNTYSDRESLILAVNNSIPYIGGGTKTADALYLLINQGFVGARPKIQGVPRVAMVVTGGPSNDPKLTVTAAEALRRVVPSIMTYAVGIGNTNRTELNTIASTRNGQKLVRYISSFDLTELEWLQEDLRELACTASTVVDMHGTSIYRQFDFKTKLYLEYFVPGDGFTIQVELDVGSIVVCGSNSLERPDCSYSLTYDWKLEVSEYKELFIRPDGSPSNMPVPSSAPTTSAPTQATSPTNAPNGTQANSNVTVYITIEGADEEDIFSFNITYGDTRTSKASAATVIAPAEVVNRLDLLVIIGAAGGGAFVAILVCLFGVCVLCCICFCTRSRKKSVSYKPLNYAV